MTARGALAAIALAALSIWLVLALDTPPGGDALLEPAGDTAGAGATRDETMRDSARLEGQGAPAAAPAERSPAAFRFRAVQAGTERVLSDIRLDCVATGYLGITDDAGLLALERTDEVIVYEATARGYLLSRGTARRDATTTITMTPGVVARGVVRDRDTKLPVTNAALRVWDDDAARFISGTRATDAEGQFDLHGVRLSHPFTILVQIEGRVPSTSHHQVFVGETELEVLVGGGGTITGVVKGLGPNPPKGLPVFLVAARTRLPGDERRPAPGSTPRPGARADQKEAADRKRFMTFQTRTDGAGAFEIQGVPLDQALVAVARIDSRERLRSQAIQLTSRKRSQHVELKQEARGALTLIIIDESGAAVRHASLELRGAYLDITLPTGVIPDGGGGRRYDDLPAGSYTLVVKQPDGPETHKSGVHINGGTRPTVIVKVLTGQTLSGIVRGPGGEGVPGAQLTWIPGADGDPAVMVKANRAGRFLMRGVRGTSKALRVHPPQTYDGQSRYTRIDAGHVAAGQDNLTFVLEGVPPIEGSVFGARPIKRLIIDVYGDQYRKRLHYRVGDKGYFLFQGPAETTGILVFRVKGYAPRYLTYEGPVDLDRKLTRVWMESEAAIPVTVRKAGQPVPGALIRPVDPRLPYRWRSNEMGEADLHGLPASRTKVYVDAPYHAPTAHTVGPSVMGTRHHLEMGPVQGLVEGHIPRQLLRYQPTVMFRLSKPGRSGKQKKWPHRAQVDRAGKYRILLPAGRYEVAVFGLHGLNMGGYERFTVKQGVSLDLDKAR